ncbi:MAG: uL22 family ribosomal protein, partial [Patescibacteria group bacterium]
MEVRAKLRFLRMSPRKVRLVVDVIRGRSVEEAEHRLMYVQKLAVRPVLKLLKSAIANAENNFKLKKDNLFVKKAF